MSKVQSTEDQPYYDGDLSKGIEAITAQYSTAIDADDSLGFVVTVRHQGVIVGQGTGDTRDLAWRHAIGAVMAAASVTAENA